MPPLGAPASSGRWRFLKPPKQSRRVRVGSRIRLARGPTAFCPLKFAPFLLANIPPEVSRWSAALQDPLRVQGSSHKETQPQGFVKSKFSLGGRYKGLLGRPLGAARMARPLK